jgi:FixJ family two-component response regulator
MTQKRPLIAIVDDDLRVLESLEELLESAGYRVQTFAGAAALLAADYSSIDCLITDIGMPEIDGFQLLEIVKRSRPGLPIFLISGRHEIADQARATAKNISGFFRKPFDAHDLLAKVGDAMWNTNWEDADAS